MSQFKYEKLILDTAKALQCFIEEYKRDRPKFLNNNNNNNNNQQQPQIGELTEDKVKLITTYALLNLTNVNNQKDFNLAVERYLNDLKTSEDGKTYVRYNNTWKEVNFNDLQGRTGRDVDPAVINRINTELSNKVDKGTYSGTAKDLNDKIDQVNSVLSQKASTNHTHNWNDIQSKPSINKSGNVYTIPGIGGNIEIPSLVGSNKPELNYLPLTGGTVTGNINLNGSLLINDKTRVEVRNNGNIAFGNKPFNDLVIGEFKGIQLWGQGNDKVVLAGGEVTNLSELKNENVKVGGRNYVLKSKEKQTSVGYIGKYWTLSEPAIVGIQYTFSCYASVEDGRQLCVYFTDIDGQRRQYIITDLVNGYNEFTIIPNYAWTGLCAFHEVPGVSPVPTATIEKLKFEKGNKATDWTPAPEDLIAEKTWEKQQHSLYGESLVTTLPSVQREIVIDNNSNSKNNLWTADNELNVGSRNVGGYAKINCNGYKLTDKDDNFVLTAGGGAKNLSDFDFYKGSIEPNDLNVFQSRKTGVYVVKYPVGWGTLVNFKSGGSTSSIEFLKRNWYAWSRIGVRNSVDDARFNEDNGEFCDLAWYSDVYRPGIIRYNWDATKEHQNDTVFVSQSGYIELNQLENLSSMSFRKVFSNGNVEFRCSGKQIIYTGDNQFNGKDGSTAVVSIYENKCYIDIRNI